MATSDILISGARLFYAPVGETVPSENSVDYGDAWGGNWVEVGYTNSPVAWNVKRDEYDVKAQQVIGTLKRVATNEEHTLETTLIEVTPAHLQLAIGGTASTTSAGAGQVGKDELVAGGEVLLDERAWGIEGMYVDSNGTAFPVRLFVWKATSVINGNLEFAKESEAGISLQIKALQDVSQSAGQQFVKLQRVTAAATS